jgi:transcriptional regulator with XRE-family HTH domain
VPCGLNAPALALVIRLRMIKEALGLSLSDLSDRTHYSRASWERWLNGKRLISDSALLSFSAAARMNPEPLLRLRSLAAQQPLIEGTADNERAAPACARARQQGTKAALLDQPPHDAGRRLDGLVDINVLRGAPAKQPDPDWPSTRPPASREAEVPGSRMSR